jgi:hypothetical protein
MEIRRIEGVLLYHALEQSQGLKAQRAGEELRIRVLSTVPEVLLELTGGGGSTIRAKVSNAEGTRVLLSLPQGFEIEAENRSSLNLMAGDTVELTVEETNPLTFRISGLYRRPSVEELIKTIFEDSSKFFINMNPLRLKEAVENSGLFYERKLVDLLLDKVKPEELLGDAKAHLLQTLFLHAKELSKLLGVEYEKSLQGIKGLIEQLKTTMAGKKELLNAVKTLRLESTSHEEYLQLIKTLESLGEREVLRALEKGEWHTFIKFLYELRDKGVKLGDKLEKALSYLEGSQEPAVRDFVKALTEYKDPKTAYSRLMEEVERANRLMDFYQTKLPAMEQLFHRLELIVGLQQFFLRQGKAFYIPFYYEGAKGGLAFLSGETYTVFFRLSYEEGYVAGFLKMPEKEKLLDIRILTNMEGLAKAIREKKDMLEDMLKEEGIRLKSISVSVESFDTLKEEVGRAFYKEGFLLVV